VFFLGGSIAEMALEVCLTLGVDGWAGVGCVGVAGFCPWAQWCFSGRG